MLKNYFFIIVVFYFFSLWGMEADQPKAIIFGFKKSIEINEEESLEPVKEISDVKNILSFLERSLQSTNHMLIRDQLKIAYCAGQKLTLKNRINFIKKTLSEQGYPVVGIREGARETTNHLLVFECALQQNNKSKFCDIVYNKNTHRFKKWNHNKSLEKLSIF